MAKGHDYISFRDAVIVALADAVEPPGFGAVRLISLCERYNLQFEETWIMILPQDLAESGLAEDWSTHDSIAVRITGKGIARATEIRRSKSRPIVNFVNSMNWQMWAVVAAVLIGIATIIFS